MSAYSDSRSGAVWNHRRRLGGNCRRTGGDRPDQGAGEIGLPPCHGFQFLAILVVDGKAVWFLGANGPRARAPSTLSQNIEDP